MPGRGYCSAGVVHLYGASVIALCKCRRFATIPTMLRVKNIYNIVIIFMMMVFLRGGVAPVFAAEAPLKVLITEVQTGAGTAGQEFIELYNASDETIDLADVAGTAGYTWKLQYFSGGKVTGSTFDWETTAPSGTIALTGTIAAHEYYLLSTTGYAPGSTEPDMTYSPHLANEAGGVRLVTVRTSSKQITTQDTLAWCDASTPLPNECTVLPHSALGSWQRQPTADDTYIDEQGIVRPFTATTDISPKGPWQEMDAVVDAPAPDPATEPDQTADPGLDTGADTTATTDDDQTAQPDAAATEAPPSPLAPPKITELLPNPAAPASDSTDEFIELYNPNDQPFALDGYVLETGATNSYRHAFGVVSIPPLSYAVVTSGNSALSLANSGGHARLLDAEGTVVAQTADYTDAPEGEAWADIDGTWQWTTTATAMAPNVLTIAPVPAPKATTSKATATKKTATAKKATTKKAASAAKTLGSSTKKTPTKADTAAAAADNQPEDTEVIAPIHGGILAAAGLLAVAYAAYEYRQDIAHRFYQLRRYRADRRTARASAKGR